MKIYNVMKEVIIVDVRWFETYIEKSFKDYEKACNFLAHKESNNEMNNERYFIEESELEE